jgi:tetratricopeptide (TPR) repeat protein
MALIVFVAACGGQEQREAAYLERGQALFAEGKLVKARLEFRNVLQINPKSVAALHYLGQIEEKQGNWQQAFAFYTQVVQEDPAHADAHLKLGHLYLLGNDLEKADEQAAILERLVPETPDLFALKASLALRRGRPHEAQLLSEGALTKDPAHIAAAMVLASALANQAETPAGLAVLDRTIEKNPDNTPARLLKIKLLLDADRFDEAVAVYNEVIALEPETFQYRLNLAQLYASRDRIDDAERVLRASAEAGVGGTEATLAIVDLLIQRSGVDAAEAELKRLIDASPDQYSYVFKLADLYAGHDRVGDAKALLERIAEADDDGADGQTARVALARLALIDGDRERALPLAEAVLDADPNNADALLIRGALALEAGDTDGALGDARTVLRTAPKSAPALRLLVQTQLRRGENELAMDTLGVLVDVSPDDFAAREQLAGLHVSRGNLEPALDIYNAVLAREPNRPESLLPKAEVLIALQRWDEADRTIDSILALPEHEAAGHLLSGRRYQARGSVEPAVGEFKAAAALRPDAAEPLTGIVQTYVAAERYDDALAHLNEVIAATPDNAVAMNLKGEVLSRQDRVDEAAEAFAAASALLPEWDIPYRNRGSLLFDAGRTDDAVAAFGEGLARLPDNQALLFLLAAAQEQAGDAMGAIETYERILGSHADADVAANNFAALVADFAYQDEKRLEAAIDRASRFETSNNPYYLDTLGWLHYRQGDFAQARIYLDRAVALGADLPIVHYHLGMALFHLNDLPGARRELEAALAKDADYPGRDEAKTTLAGLTQS